MKFKYYIVDVFSPTPFGGNQLAVLPEARGLTADGMQKIAREFNFAETTFVLPPDNPRHSCKVRIFTPKAELMFAGHPTVGTAVALVLGGHNGSGTISDLVLEEGIGPVAVKVERSKDGLLGTLTLTGPVEQAAEHPDPKKLAEALSLTTNDVIGGFFASVGLRFCFAHLKNREVVDRAAIDRAAWSKHMANAWSSNIFFFAGEIYDGAELYARMCAPR
jgi:trans-2,3-dihydro-3-hydroxyanthranilate isomerase